ncbi:MAG: RnfABCDGE type electron transport complex subunit C, partial [Clostridia bacterium]|nr:RnfABCDGE type electron transport complex subunit C [Clostridia bacterium]
MKHLFFGGIHPKYNKEMSTEITNFRTINPKQVVIPMQQHIGSPCTPIVKVGDHVLRGQKIGDGEGLCVPVHASVSGIVSAIEMRPHPSLGSCMAVVIDNDFQDTTVTNTLPTTDDEILASIREAGIVGMGGAAFPGSVKALAAMGKIDTLIANACECEPYITSDDSLLRTNPEHVLDGMMILFDLLDPEHLVLAVEDNKAEAIKKIQALLGDYPKIELKILPTEYPQGAEKQLVQAVTGREVPPTQLPVNVGCAVF